MDESGDLKSEIAKSQIGRLSSLLIVQQHISQLSLGGRALYAKAINCPCWPGLLLNRQFLLARIRRAFLQDSPTPGGSLRVAHRGLISFTPPACKPAARKGCEDISPGLSEAV
jgi:hypothetical protein